VTFDLSKTYTGVDASITYYTTPDNCSGNETKIGRNQGTVDKVYFTLPVSTCVKYIQWNSNETKGKTVWINEILYNDKTFYAGTAPPPPPPPPEPKIIGHVYTEWFTPLSGAFVTFDYDTAVTDSNGYYEIVNPTPMSGYITCEAYGYQTAEQWISSPTDETLIVDFTLIQG